MKILDAMGNTLLPGQKLYWKQADLYVTVKAAGPVNEGKIGSLTVEVQMGVPAQKDAAQFPMFIRVVDPAIEPVIEKAMIAR